MERGKKQSNRKRPQDTRAPVSVDGLELDARRTQRLGTIEILRNGRTPLHVIEVAERAAALADQAIRSAIATHPPRRPIACQEGCAWCCHKRVGTSAAEVIRIVEFLRDRLSAEEVQATQ